MYKFLSIVIVAFVFTNCKSTVNPNEWVVSTATCWNSMTVTKAGSPLPRLYTACDRMVILPATELSADFNCETKFKNRVAGSINLTYQWKIADPIQFIQSAKSITSSSTSDDYKVNPEVLEEVENNVVDKMLIDLIREYTPSQEAGIDESKIEQEISALAKVKFANRGVEFFNMSVNVNFTSQTEEALDVISALEFYKASGEEELGKQVILQKAGATKIIVQQQNSSKTEE